MDVHFHSSRRSFGPGVRTRPATSHRTTITLGTNGSPSAAWSLVPQHSYRGQAGSRTVFAHIQCTYQTVKSLNYWTYYCTGNSATYHCTFTALVTHRSTLNLFIIVAPVSHLLPLLLTVLFLSLHLVTLLHICTPPTIA